MKVVSSRTRRLAVAVSAHAAAVLPPEKSPWAGAMRHEILHIGGDSEALAWAIGCVAASYVERSRVGSLLQFAWVRAVVVLFLLFRAVDLLFATALTLAYRLDFRGLASFLGAFAPGENYHRLIPLMDATPWQVHALRVTAGFLCILAAGQLIRGRWAAFLSFAAAWTLACAGEFIGSALPEYRAVFSNRPRGLAGDYLIPAARAVVPIVIAAGLWAHSRCLAQHLPRAVPSVMR